MDPGWVEETFDQVALLVLEGDAAGLAAVVGELASARRCVVRGLRAVSGPDGLLDLRPGSMVVFAFSLQDQVEKYGAYVGIASFFGLAILSLLYFAQAREVKRLREWAGRAPERAAEVEALAIQHAEEAQRAAEEDETAAPAPAAAPAAVPAAANGAVKLKPAEVAALAFARAAGVHTPHAPRQHPVPAAALAATPTDVAAAGAAVATGEATAAQDVAPTTAEPPAVPAGPDEPAAPAPASARTVMAPAR